MTFQVSSEEPTRVSKNLYLDLINPSDISVPDQTGLQQDPGSGEQKYFAFISNNLSYISFKY